ncbi:TetR/AcrR family transcriptional regulator [Salana multivorans]
MPTQRPDTTGTNAGQQPPRRTYRSELRAEQAARTRTAVVDAARHLFESQGFAATTIAAIAAEAGVSAQTIYASFGSKAALARAIVGQMEESAEAATWRERIAAEQEPERILAAFAQWTRALFEASSPSFAIAQEAAAELTELARQGDQQRRRGLTSLVERLDAAGALRPGLPLAVAVDRAWIVTSIQTYVHAVEGCGWSPDDYAEWLAETLAAQVLARPRPTA